MKQITRKIKPTTENNQQQLTKEVEYQQNRFILNQKTIEFLQQKIEDYQHITSQKRQTIQNIEKQIHQIQDKKSKLPFIKQLRQHFKKLKQQLGNTFMYQVEQDDIDVDQMTYQQLLQLEEKIGKVSKGLAKQQIEQLEKFNYQCQMAQPSCTICRDQFQIEQQCVKLKCNHIFHNQCVKPWLQIEKVCPLCKQEIK